ncbi:bacteriorhodopsin [Halovivax sp.]|uniref:bacteriorhodopsin n=1 Tax=Halovivax sp. TaxID=1935978 RepID=UPI0025C0F389|nr:bacteriorhodopsin [Halovivax sp.]
MIPELQLYQLTAAVLAIVTLGTVVATVRLPPRRRQYGLACVVIAGSMGAAYVLMSVEFLTIQNVEGEWLPAARFGAYLIAFSAMLAFLTHVAGVGYRWMALLIVLLVGVIGGTVTGWYFDEPISLAAAAVTVGCLTVQSVVLLRSIPARATRVSDERRLLFGKLRNLGLLIWWLYIVVGLVSRQNLGLLDAFVGIFIGAYLDVVIVVGFVAILLRNGEALDHLRTSELGDGPSDGDSDAASEPVTPSPAE